MSLSADELKKIPYTNLITHTHFSMPMGVGNVKAHIKRVLKCGHEGFAITDSSVMSGALEVYKLSKDKDYLKKLGVDKLPFILGIQLNIIDDLERKDKVNKYFNITCFAKNAIGYRNLVSLTSNSSKDDHFYVRPRISLPELIEHSEGLIVLSGDINGMISQSILRETGQEELLVEIFKENFGEDFYMEMHFQSLEMSWDKTTKTYLPQNQDPQQTVNLRLIELAQKYDVKCVLVQNAFMPEKKNKVLQDILIGNSPFGKDGWKFHNSYYHMPVEEMYAEVKRQAPYISDEQFKEWCENTHDVLAKAKDFKISFKPALPIIPYEESVVNKDAEWEEKFQQMKQALKAQGAGLYELFEVAEEDMSLKTAFKVMIRNNKINILDQKYSDRLLVELKVIQRNGIIKLCDYFLLLEDVTHFVRESGYLRGFGRGSGAGSLVAYALDITDCDPLVFDLLFERFLTKERVGKFNFEIPGFDFNELSKE